MAVSKADHRGAVVVISWQVGNGRVAFLRLERTIIDAFRAFFHKYKGVRGSEPPDDTGRLPKDFITGLVGRRADVTHPAVHGNGPAKPVIWRAAGRDGSHHRTGRTKIETGGLGVCPERRMR